MKRNSSTLQQNPAGCYQLGKNKNTAVYLQMISLGVYVYEMLCQANCHQKYRFQICPIGGVKIRIQSEPTTISAPYLLFAYIPGGLKIGKNYSSAP